MRFTAALPLLLAVSLAEIGPAGLTDRASVAVGDVGAVTRRADLIQGLQVLHAWDDRRELAWAGSDPQALRGLYTPGSQAGRVDLRLLRAYASRGLVVRRIVTQVFAARVLHRGSASLRLRVFDRVAGGAVVEHGQVRALASSRPVARTIEFRLAQGGWRVASVSDSGRDPRAARR